MRSPMRRAARHPPARYQVQLESWAAYCRILGFPPRAADRQFSVQATEAGLADFAASAKDVIQSTVPLRQRAANPPFGSVNLHPRPLLDEPKNCCEFRAGYTAA
jgi:hypothetical protein